ncbi:RanBP-type and C3HC4-type zinc finger-containing protein 1 [Halotydeus destructor]|nr:RanBP-type and C3HC4-type zinc finger-containing protein 1 [Halotydeus destructor]
MAHCCSGDMYRKLVELDDEPIVTNNEPFECSICQDTFPIGRGITLRNCLHNFCRDCISGTIKHSEELEVKCPFVGDRYTCDSVLQDREVRLLAPQAYEQYTQRRLNAFCSSSKDVFHCSAPNCEMFVELDGQIRQFECGSCRKMNCVLCKAIHEGMSCEQWKSKLLSDENAKKTNQHLKTLLGRGEAMACLQCGVVITKNGGCNWIKCAMCKTELCWITRNFRWGPRMARRAHNSLYRQLVRLDDLPVITNSVAFECSICYDSIAVGSGIVLRDCLHQFCRDCIQNLIKNSEDIEVKCPFRSDEYTCPSVLQDREVREISPREFSSYVQRRLNAASSRLPDFFQCRTPNCIYGLELTEATKRFRCPVCRKWNCTECRAAHHGMSCQQWQNFELFNPQNENLRLTGSHLEQIIRDGVAMKCLQCNAVLTKIDGCHWIKCGICQTELCWVTRNFRWGPKGRGDTSAGCRCGVNGQKCHPSCNTCTH